MFLTWAVHFLKRTNFPALLSLAQDRVVFSSSKNYVNHPCSNVLNTGFAVPDPRTFSSEPDFRLKHVKK